MTEKVGLWIDHKKAIIVTIDEKGEKIDVIRSNAESQLRRTGDSPLKGPFERMLIPADMVARRIFVGQLNMYYDQVIDFIHEAESILILGPGKAKNELKDRLQEKHLEDRIIGLETADKMTDRQIAVRVRQQFAE